MCSDYETEIMAFTGHMRGLLHRQGTIQSDWAAKAKRLSRKMLEQCTELFTPDTIMRW
jgi:hypothetical protein